MAVTIVDRRTTINDAQATTNWTGAGYGTTPTSAEDTLAVAESLAIATGQTYYTDATARNLGTSPGTLVYVWSFNNALQNAWDASPPPHALLLGDGTDRIGFDMAGQDRRVFSHLEGPTGLDVNGWQCLVLDTGQASTMNTNGNTYVVNGSFAGLDFANITQFGSSFDTQSKALGGGYNVAVDIIRFGNDGIYVLGGTTSTRGLASEIAAGDRSRAADAAHGIWREYTTIAFGVQGPVTFGRDDVATDSWFDDSAIVIVFEDRNIGNDKYYLNQRGHVSADNYFILTNSTVTSAGPHVGMDFTGGDIDEHTSTDNTFSNLGDRPIVYPTTADSAANFTVERNVYDNCGKITLNDTDFPDCTISNPAPTTDYALVYGGSVATGLSISGYEGTAGTAAILSNVNIDMNGELDNLTATKGTNATHVIELGANTPTSITLNGWTVSGYNGSNGQNDSVIYNNSNKAITVNVSGNTGTISYRNGGTSTTTIQASADYTLNGIQPNSDVTILDYDVSLLDLTGTAANQNVGDVTANTKVGQSFQVPATGKAERIRLNLRKVGSPTDGIRIRLVSGNPGGTQQRISDYIDGADLTTSYVEYDVDLQGRLSLSTATDYGIEIERSGANDGSNYYQVEYSTTSVDANGERWLNNGTWSSTTGDLLLSVMDSAGDNELQFDNDVTTGTVTYTHGGQAKTIEVIVSNLSFLQLAFLDTIGGSDKSQTVVQTPDLVYLNP